MTSRFFLYDLLKSALSEQGYHVRLDIAESHEVLPISINQGIAGVAFQGLRRSMTVQGIEKKQIVEYLPSYDKWIATTVSIILHHDKILRLQDKLSSEFQKVGIKALVLKGLSVANYYDEPQLRYFGDLDIYSPRDYLGINEILKSISASLKVDYYRHSECKMDDVVVENHKYLTDVRGQSRFYNLESFLCVEASANLATVSEGGLYYPSECFTFLFFIYHALSHFLYEKLSLKFLVDWCVMLRGRKYLDLNVLDEKLNEFDLMHFAATMTALSMQRLGLQEKYVSNGLLVEVKSLNPSVIERFEHDMFICDYEKFSSNSLRDRLKRGKGFYKKQWKVREFLNVSATVFLWEKMCALMRHKFEIKDK